MLDPDAHTTMPKLTHVSTGRKSHKVAEADAEACLAWALRHPDTFRAIARKAFADAFGDLMGTAFLGARRLRQVVLNDKNGHISPENR